MTTQFRLEECFYNSEHISDKWQPYFEVYERHLGKFADKDIHFIEVGVQGGGSLDMWAQYFGKGSTITGIDVDEECANLKFSKPNISVTIGNQQQPFFWNEFLKDHTIDVFVDDGSHICYDQMLTFEKVFPALNMGGVYICEDVHTSFWDAYGGGPNRRSFTKYCYDLVERMHNHWRNVPGNELIKDLTSIHFYDSMIVFEKNGKKDMKNVFSQECDRTPQVPGMWFRPTGTGA